MTELDNITRRDVIGSVAVGAGLVAAAASSEIVGATRAQSAPKTFMLIHGAWHGGWCWRRVADRLEGKGHKVFSPTLTGVGERSHLLNKDINLDTHITDIVNVIKWEDLKDICHDDPIVLPNGQPFVPKATSEVLADKAPAALAKYGAKTKATLATIATIATWRIAGWR